MKEPKKEFRLYSKPRAPGAEPLLVTQCLNTAIEFTDKLDLELVIAEQHKADSLLNLLVDGE